MNGPSPVMRCLVGSRLRVRHVRSNRDPHPMLRRLQPPPPPALRELSVPSVAGKLTAARATDSAKIVGAKLAGCVLALRRDAAGGWLALTVSRKGAAGDVGLPGGKAERGEEPSVAAVRELREETGYALEPVDAYLLVPLLAADGDRGLDAVTSCLSVTYLLLGPPLPPSAQHAPTEGESGVVAWLPLDAALASSKSFAVYNARVAAVLKELLPALPADLSVPADADAVVRAVEAAMAHRAARAAAAIAAVDARERAQGQA
jgi:8-oxo-dGTP pyrophosphatase MutT (NUDIX family)